MAKRRVPPTDPSGVSVAVRVRPALGATSRGKVFTVDADDATVTPRLDALRDGPR